MATRRYRKIKGKKTHTKKRYGGKSKMKSALSAAEGTLKKTGSLNAAKKSLRKQALSNARKLFGSI
jgi:hypothetical protein